jgi:tRNA threonylcarbamoyladenosine biosynthesis protein TsaE
MKTISKSLEETKVFAEDLLSLLEKKKAHVVFLYGDLGAGKTALVKEVANLLGVLEHVTSPTYVLEKKYAVKHSVFSTLIHIDAYRLSSMRDLELLNWEELVEDSSNLIFIEWPKQVGVKLPEGGVEVDATFVDESTRQYEVLV